MLTSQYLGHFSADVLVVPTTAENCAYALYDKYSFSLYYDYFFINFGHQLATLVNCATHEYHQFFGPLLGCCLVTNTIQQHYQVNRTKFTLACDPYFY